MEKIVVNEVTFDVLYYNPDNGGRGPGRVYSHKYNETWKKIDMYCPACGHQAVWQEQSAGDYYVGEGFLCLDCKSTWTIQGPVDFNEKHEQDVQRFKALADSEKPILLKLDGVHEYPAPKKRQSPQEEGLRTAGRRIYA